MYYELLANFNNFLFTNHNYNDVSDENKNNQNINNKDKFMITNNVTYITRIFPI